MSRCLESQFFLRFALNLKKRFAFLSAFQVEWSCLLGNTTVLCLFYVAFLTTLSDSIRKSLIDWFWLPIFRTNLVRGFWNKEMEIQNKGAVLVQIAPLFISQPRNQNQSIALQKALFVCNLKAGTLAVQSDILTQKTLRRFSSEFRGFT